MNHIEYGGMSYRQASLEGERLVKKAAETGNWFSIIGQLQELMFIMKMSPEARQWDVRSCEPQAVDCPK